MLGFKQKNSREAVDPILLRCPHCNRLSWSERHAVPEVELTNTHTGTWLRCGHKDCDKPFAVPSREALSKLAPPFASDERTPAKRGEAK